MGMESKGGSFQNKGETMNKEIVVQQTSTTKLKILNNKIDAVFRSHDTKTGIRLYDGKHIGVAGGIGKVDENALTNKAKDMLKFSIPYPLIPAKNSVKKIDLSNEFNITDKELADITQELLSKLTKNYPDFSFSESISIEEGTESLKNDCATDLLYNYKSAQLNLGIKYKKSLNMFDGMVSNITRMYTLEDAYAACIKSLDAFENKVDIKDSEKLPVIFYDDNLVSFFYEHLHGKMFGAKASMFSGKVDQKLFSDKFSLCINRSPYDNFTCFFDGEGMMLDGNRVNLIENGVIKMPYASRKAAKDFGLTETASAFFIYDSVPDTSGEGMDIVSSGKTLKQLIGGQRAILVEMALGGDYTAQGEYSTPAQIAYLWENGKRIGRLPQIALSSTVFDLFGKDFIGKATDGPYKNSPLSKYTVFNMKINKIGGHQ